MAPKGGITVAGLHIAAAKASAREAQTLPSDAGVALSCRFLGVSDGNGGVLPEARPTCRNDALFRWTAIVGLRTETIEVAVRCDNAVDIKRIIPVPEVWKVALQCLKLDSIAATAARALTARSALEALDCQVLGIAKPSPLPRPGRRLVPGATAVLREPGGQLHVLLCALVSGSTWICYGPDCKRPLGGPISAEDLLVRDIVAEAAEPAAKRAKVAARPTQLSAWAATQPAAWNSIVALARFKAEEHVAAQEHRALDASLAAAGYEPSAWLWPAGSGRAELASLWRWQRSGEQRHELVLLRLDSVLGRQTVPHPVNTDADGNLYDRLLRSADIEAELRKAPCRYMGLELNDGAFEPDPARWSPEAIQASLGKLKVSVSFRWEHVARDGAPLHGSISASNLLHLDRPVPHNPLQRGAPYGITITPDFVAAVAGNTLPGQLGVNTGFMMVANCFIIV